MRFPSRRADRLVIGNVSRTLEQLPNYAASDKGFFTEEGIVGDVVLIGSTDTLIQALIAGHVQVAIVDPSAAINAIERGQTNSRLHEFKPKFFLDRYWGG